MASKPSLFKELDTRRRALRMTIPQLARRSGVSTATVSRVLRGEPTVAVGHLTAVAKALGLEVGIVAQTSVKSLVQAAALAKARRAAALVQATSALEGQGLAGPQLEAMVDRTYRELQSHGGKTLWAD
jgi:transcriptional regulator with XRE-family HTH domain